MTRATFKLLDASAVIYGEYATEKDAAFIARELIQATLPHESPGNVPGIARPEEFRKVTRVHERLPAPP